MNQRDLDRLKVIREVVRGRLKQKEGAEQLGLSTRQVRKLSRRVRQEGNRGIIHGLRGKASNHRLAEGLMQEALKIVQAHYWDFGPTLANEKLRQRHGMELSTTGLRKGMIEAGVWKARRPKIRHRGWRERRACFGELVQLDGSMHRWFEERGPMCVLLAYIDDATSRLGYAELVQSEDTMTLLRTTGVYVERYGRPVAFYVDKDSIYKINRQASIEEQLRDSQPTTQFTRAMQELGIEVIMAHSPQAKGRVERLFGTLQDRLIKELRLAGIDTIAAGNEFLWDKFIAQYNERFSVPARNGTDAHRPLRKSQKLEVILSIRTERTLLNDFTVRHDNRWYQVAAEQRVRVRPGDKISVQTRLDRTVHLCFRGCSLQYQVLDARPATIAKQRQKPNLKVHRGHRWKPPSTHPWRRRLLLNTRPVAAVSGEPTKRMSRIGLG